MKSRRECLEIIDRETRGMKWNNEGLQTFKREMCKRKGEYCKDGQSFIRILSALLDLHCHERETELPTWLQPELQETR